MRCRSSIAHHLRTTGDLRIHGASVGKAQGPLLQVDIDGVARGAGQGAINAGLAMLDGLSSPNLPNGYIDSDPSRNSVLSSHTLTSTGRPRRTSARALRSVGTTWSCRVTSRPSAPKPRATSW